MTAAAALRQTAPASHLGRPNGADCAAGPRAGWSVDWRFAPAAAALEGSAIREILKVTEQPAVLSFAGGLPNPAAFPVEALRAAKPTGLPRGHVELDEFGNPVQSIYIRRVDRVNGEPQNTVIATIPRVSQFWKYNPADYLRQPLYSRRFVPGT